MISNFWQISPSGPNSLWLHTTKWEIGLQQTGTCWHCKNANLHLQRFYVRHRQSEYLPVRPDLAKFSHFGNILHVFDIYWTLDFLFGKMLSLLWRIWYIIGVIFIVASGHILKNWKIIYPSGHTGTYVWPSDRQIFFGTSSYKDLHGTHYYVSSNKDVSHNDSSHNVIWASVWPDWAIF